LLTVYDGNDWPKGMDGTRKSLVEDWSIATNGGVSLIEAADPLQRRD